MEVNTNYLAITIGPLFKTMSLAKKTRELWSVSFTFSLLMKQLIDAFSKCGKLLSPGNGVQFPLHGAGIYPDRCYFELPEGLLTEEQVSAIKETAFSNFNSETGLSKSEDYYQVYIVQAAISANPIGTLNQMLDVLELQQQYAPKQVIDWKKQWESGVYFQKLYDKGFSSTDELLPDLFLPGNIAVRRFPSIPEISTNEFAKRNSAKYWQAIGYQGLVSSTGAASFTRSTDLAEQVEDDDSIIKQVKKAFPDDFLQRHKYFSIVKADGDNVGKLIAAIEGGGGNITALSNCLNSFSATAVDALVKYGAFPVYAGGDDLLFFAPVANNVQNDNSIFSLQTAHGNVFGNNLFFLLTYLNNEFKKALAPVLTSNVNVSLSFGVMCGFYKQPIKEIQEAAYNALNDAKQQYGKNHISMKVQKHSGQSFSMGFGQESHFYYQFLELSKAAAAKGGFDENFLNSLMYKLDDQKIVLKHIAGDTARLKQFFKENFNESYKRFTIFFERMELLVGSAFADFPGLPLDVIIEKIYGALRFVHFINAKDVTE